MRIILCFLIPFIMISFAEDPHLYISLNAPLSLLTLSFRVDWGDNLREYTLHGFEKSVFPLQDVTGRLRFIWDGFILEGYGSLTIPDYVGYYTWGPGGETSQERELIKEWKELKERTGYDSQYYDHFNVGFKIGLTFIKEPYFNIAAIGEWSKIDNEVIFKTVKEAESPYHVSEDGFSEWLKSGYKYHDEYWYAGLALTGGYPFVDEEGKVALLGCTFSNLLSQTEPPIYSFDIFLDVPPYDIIGVGISLGFRFSQGVSVFRSGLYASLSIF